LHTYPEDGFQSGSQPTEKAMNKENRFELAPITDRIAFPVDEARSLLGGISRKSIYDLINSGELKTVMIAGRRLVPKEALYRLIEASWNQPQAAA
jgi:excisionase family DNA binding protein